jgi:hypothetical protein
VTFSTLPYSSCKSDDLFVPLGLLDGLIEDLGQGVVAPQGERLAELFCDPESLLPGESSKDLVGQKASGTQECLIEFGGHAVDGADDLEIQEIGEEAVRDVEQSWVKSYVQLVRTRWVAGIPVADERPIASSVSSREIILQRGWVIGEDVPDLIRGRKNGGRISLATSMALQDRSLTIGAMVRPGRTQRSLGGRSRSTVMFTDNQ